MWRRFPPPSPSQVPDTTLECFTALVKYLLTDVVELWGHSDDLQPTFELMMLSRKYQVRRLELLCAQALQESVAPATAVARSFDQTYLGVDVETDRRRTEEEKKELRRKRDDLWRKRSARS